MTRLVPGIQQTTPNQHPMAGLPSLDAYTRGESVPATEVVEVNPQAQPQTVQQKLAALTRAYSEFHKNYQASIRLQQIVDGTAAAPVVKLTFPTGVKGSSDEQIVLEVDLLDVTRKMTRSPEEAVQLGRQILGPIAAYLTQTYMKSLGAMKRELDAMYPPTPQPDPRIMRNA